MRRGARHLTKCAGTIISVDSTVISPFKKAARLIEISVHAAIDFIVGDGVDLLHAIEQTEHEKAAIQSPRRRLRRSKKRR